jgi:hypothetical protein
LQTITNLIIKNGRWPCEYAKKHELQSLRVLLSNSIRALLVVVKKLEVLMHIKINYLKFRIQEIDFHAYLLSLIFIGKIFGGFS